ncbi:28179_t:CDS:2, partial [Racocetra persica]
MAINSAMITQLNRHRFHGCRGDAKPSSFRFIKLSHSEETISDKCDSLVNSDNDNAFDKHYNPVNSDNDNVTNEHNNPVNEESHSVLPERSYNASKLPNLKEIKLVSLKKHSGRSWIWSYYQRYKPVLPYKTIVSCLVKVYNSNKEELCGHIMDSVDSSMGNYIGHLATRHGITESLKDFIAEFDQSYQFLSEKYCRQLLSEAYENTKQSLLN